MPQTAALTAMRLMILTADYPPNAWSGIAYAVESQAHALVESGADVHVLVANSRAAPQRKGPRVIRLDPSTFPVDPRGFERIHLHSLSLAALAFELRRRYRLPVTYTAHSLLSAELDPGPESTAWIKVQREVLRASDSVVFLSQSERQSAVRTMPEIAARSVVIGNALPPPPAPKRRPNIGGPIVFAGRFTANKGIELLSRLLPRIIGKGKAVLAGGHGDGCATPLIENLRASLGDKCRIAGWLPRPSLRALLSGAALVLVPSLYEPFGLVALEAMRLGAPVLASRVGGLAEIVTPESGGRLAAARDLTEWTDKASQILESPNLWNALHRQGPGYVAERFSPAYVADRLLREAYA